MAGLIFCTISFIAYWICGYILLYTPKLPDGTYRENLDTTFGLISWGLSLTSAGFILYLSYF